MDRSMLTKPAEYAESQLIDAVLEGTFAIGAALPAERELATRLGVTRPTLREALQRLARDGWLEIHQGKPTRVRNYWQEGNLGVLGAIANRPWAAPADFVVNLLAVRLTLAPAYARQAVERRPAEVLVLLDPASDLPGEAQAPAAETSRIARQFAEFDWQLHHGLTILSENPIYTLILNGFGELYVPMAHKYFESIPARNSSRAFYAGLSTAAQNGDAEQAEAITRRVMNASLALWKQLSSPKMHPDMEA
jgi:GntR family negative regulator for fad regulon and positive regulator of fabA